MKPDVNKFSFAQMTSNSDGKTSGSGTMGVLIIAIGSFCFLLGCIDKIFLNKDIDVITQSIFFVGIGTSLLGYRKSKAGVITDDKVLPSDDEGNEQLNS